jgi:hypothetical protein
LTSADQWTFRPGGGDQKDRFKCDQLVAIDRFCHELPSALFGHAERCSHWVGCRQLQWYETGISKGQDCGGYDTPQDCGDDQVRGAIVQFQKDHSIQ